MYKATVAVGYGTGAPEHRYGGGYGVAFHKSPKRAIRLAQRQADRSAGDMAAYCLITQRITLTNLQTGQEVTCS